MGSTNKQKQFMNVLITLVLLILLYLFPIYGIDHVYVLQRAVYFSWFRVHSTKMSHNFLTKDTFHSS